MNTRMTVGPMPCCVVLSATTQSTRLAIARPPVRPISRDLLELALEMGCVNGLIELESGL